MQNLLMLFYILAIQKDFVLQVMGKYILVVAAITQIHSLMLEPFFNLKNDTYGGRIGFSNNTATAGVSLMEQFAYWGK